MKPSVEENIVKSVRGGLSIRECAQKFKVSHTTVQRFKKKNYLLQVKQNPGRPQKMTERESRHLTKLIASGNVKTPSEGIQTMNLKVSKWTAGRNLKKLGLKAAEKKKKPLLSKKKNIMSRKKFAEVHTDWTNADWQQVIWSDETKINRFESDGCSWFWSKDPQQLTKSSVNETVKHGGGNIMVWGCITCNGVGPLIKIEGRMKKEQYLTILQENLPAAIQKTGLAVEKVIFQQDNDPKHTAKMVSSWLKSQKFSIMQWPAQSPDMNPIENLWHLVKQKLANYVNIQKVCQIV